MEFFNLGLEVAEQAGIVVALSVDTVMIPDAVFVAQKNATIARRFGQIEELINAHGKPVYETGKGDDQHGVVLTALDKNRLFRGAEFGNLSIDWYRHGA